MPRTHAGSGVHMMPAMSVAGMEGCLTYRGNTLICIGP